MLFHHFYKELVSFAFIVFVRHTTDCFLLLGCYMFCGWKHCPEEAHLNRWAKRWLIIKYNHQKSLFICLFEQKYVCMARASTNKRDCDAWSLLLLAAAVLSFAHMPLGISDRNNIISLMSLAIIFLAILSSRIGDAIAICRTTAESLVNHLVGQIVSRESVWMASSPSYLFTFWLVRLCVQSMKLMYVVFATFHIRIPLHK